MSEYATDVTLNVKVLPTTLSGTLPIASAVASSLTTQSRAWAPYPPGNVKLNGNRYATWPSTTVGDVTLSWSPRNRPTQGSQRTLVRQDNTGSGLVMEGSVTVQAYVDGILKRTWTGLTGTSQVYTLAQRTADNADLSKPVYFTITPISGAYTGIVRTTPSFVMG